MTFLFAAVSPLWTALAAIVMVLFASREIVARQKRRLPGIWSYGLGAGCMLLAAGTVTIQDFTPALGDFLVWQGIPGLTSAAVLASHATQTGGQTNVDLSSFGTNLHVVLANYTGSLAQSLFQ